MTKKDIIRAFFFVLLMLAWTAPASAGGRPEWVRKGEQSMNNKRSNTSYYFKIVSTVGRDLAALRSNQINNLSEHIGQENKIEGKAETEITNKELGGEQAESSTTFRMTFTNDFSADVFVAKVVDEYWEQNFDGLYVYYTLYAVSEKGVTPVFDSFSTSSSYGAAPVAMSIIPGLGQWYKGSKVKGICMFAAEAVAAAGIIVCDNQRASYIKKAKEQPKFVKEYSSKADNWETGRNVCIGVAAGIWVYNIVDAIVAKGTRRVVVKKANGGGLSMTPFVIPGESSGAGLSVAYHF